MMLLAILAAVFTRPMERVSTMDAAMSRSVYDARAIQLVYESPLSIDYLARPYRLAPGYCSLPEVSADELVYSFECLRGPARAVADSLERLRDPKVVSPNAWIMKSVDTVSAVGERRLEIRLKERVHYFPWLMAMSPAAVRLADGSGTGAYRLDEWKRNHSMTFSLKDESLRSAGAFGKVKYLVVDDMSTQWLMFLKGEIDFLGEVSRDNWDAIIAPDGGIDPKLRAAGVKLHSIPTLEVIYIGINMRDPVLGGNRALRQALNAAFDYPEWERFYASRILRSDGPVPPAVAGRLDAPFAYAYDLVKARRLLAEAGYPGGIDPRTGRRLVLNLSIGRANQESREAGELLASFYEKVGIKLELSFMTWDAFLKAVNEGRTQMYRMGWVGDYPDAQNFLQLFHSANVSPGPNHSDYRNPEFDREYALAMAARGEEERNRHWRRCQEIVREDCPWVFTHYNKAFSLVHKRVRNYIPSDFPYGNERHYRVDSEAK
jgi:ABC-type transport system substrate-binding protein